MRSPTGYSDMAFGYKAYYGYFTTGVISGTSNIQDMTTTDAGKWFVVAETTTIPNGGTDTVQIDEAHQRIGTITDWAGITIIPHKTYNTSGGGQYSLGLVEQTRLLLPSAFRECPNLLEFTSNPSSYQNYPSAQSVAYLADINKLLAGGNVYNVLPDGTLVQTDPSVTTLGWRADTGIGGSGPAGHAQMGLQFYVSGKGNLDEIGYSCGVLVEESGLFRVFSASDGDYDQEFLEGSWDRIRTNAFGSEDPEWSRNPFDNDPYNPINPGGGGSSQPGGGDGSFDFESENVVEIPDPEEYTSFSVTDFVSVYATRNESSLRSLAAYMWGNRFIDDLKPLKNDPFDVIIGLSIIPCNVTGTPSEVVLGNCHTEVYMNKVSSQFKRVECGTLNVKPLWDAYLDYRTKIDIYLPFIGFRRISPNDVFGHSLNVKYNVDIATGACLAFISRDGEVIASYGGNCAYQIPVTGENYSNIINGLIGAAASGISGALMGSAGAITGAIGSAINSLMQDPEIQRTGGMGGNTSYMSQRKPFLLFSAPNQCIPEMQNAIKGYPAFITRQLSVLHGFTIVDEIHLDGVGATDEEKNEIMNALKEGVIL